MRVLMINVVCGIRSTGRICTEIACELEAQGHEVKIAYGREAVPPEYAKYAVKIGGGLDQALHGLGTRILDKHGFFSKSSTREFIKWADDYDPQLLWLHNIHGYYLNIEALFKWIKSRPQMEVRWTLHDCWAFTGHCTYFTYAKCDRWKTGCRDCPQKTRYPSSYLLDMSEKNYIKKKELFTGVKDMTLITPSKWLAGLVKESFLGEYPVEVHENKINTDVFRPTESDFRQRYGLEDKTLVLGVASVWEKRKGLDDLIELSKRLDDSFKVVIVGVDARQAAAMPKNILAIMRTDSQRELAQIYTAADVFVNPTYEDNYPTVNLEARACGTPIISYNSGGCPESAGEGATVVECGNIDALYEAVRQIPKKHIRA